MRYPAEETAEKHQRILDQAALLLKERGLSKVSVSEVMKAAGLTHGAFYNHFDSKEDLIAKTVAHASATARQEMADAAASPQGLMAYLEHYLSAEHRDAPALGCIMPALGAEVSRESAAQPAFTAHVQAMVKQLSAPSGKMKSKADRSRAEALRLLSMMAGAVVLSRAVGDPALADEILDAARKGLK
ncbi:TetR/AcrR family transcriptional regulator [Roseateles sp. L2-2]|uniref:TetR/AcrR family transcriptional regulator n=1 Tax=Roseateles TaxID=93681 RepID=UPI003D36D24B